MEGCMASSSPCNCCGCPEHARAFQVFMLSPSPASLCCLCCSLLGKCFWFLHILQTHSASPRQPSPVFWPLFWPGGAPLPWASKAPWFFFVLFVYLKALICLTPLIPMLLLEALAQWLTCHTICVCWGAQVLTAQDRNWQFAFNWGGKHRINAKVSVNPEVTKSVFKYFKPRKAL